MALSGQRTFLSPLGKQIGDSQILVANERSCAFIVKINLYVPIHELSTIAYKPYSISSHFDHIITFSPSDLFVPLQAQKQEQNHISVPKILKAVELNTVKNCLLHFLTRTPEPTQTTGRPRTPVCRHDVGRRCASQFKVPALERRMTVGIALRPKPAARSSSMSSPASGHPYRGIFLRCAAARDDLPFSTLLICLPIVN